MIVPLLLALAACTPPVAGEAACRVQPPYAGVAVARVTYASAEDADRVRKALRRACGLRPLHPEAPAGMSADVLLLAKAHRRVLAADERASVEVIVEDLGATIAREREAIAPYPSGLALRAGGDGAGGGIHPLPPASVGDAGGGFRPLAPPSDIGEGVGIRPLPPASGAFADASGVRRRPPAARGVDESYYARYHTYADLVDRWRTLNATRPSLRLEVFGKSIEGRPLHLLRVGRTPASHPVRILVTGMQHSREWVTTLAALFVADSLSSSAGIRPPLARLLQRVEVLVLPLVNPDGFVYTHTHDRLWRKNRQRVRCSIGLHAFVGGVDLNRNWGVDFGGNRSTSSSPCDNMYTGRRAFDAAETAAVRDLVFRTPGIRGHVDLHAYSQFVIGPWLHAWKEPSNATVIDRVGRRLARALSGGGERYVYGRGRTSPIYRASGTATDWFFGLGVLSFTFELRPSQLTADGFDLAREKILATCREVLAAMEVFIGDVAGMHGVSVASQSLWQRRNVIKYSLTAVGLVVAVAFALTVTCWMLRQRRKAEKMYKFRSVAFEAEQGGAVDLDMSRRNTS